MENYWKKPKIFDNKTKNYIHSLTNGKYHIMKNLWLTHGFLIFQINYETIITIEVSILDSINV